MSAISVMMASVINHITFTGGSAMNKKYLRRIIVPLACVALCMAACNTQQPAEQKGTSSSFTFMGKIRYVERTNLYMVSGQNPPDEFIVENPDPKLLGDLAKSGNAVKIKGHTTIDADQLFIEEIDGKQYPGKEGSK